MFTTILIFGLSTAAEYAIGGGAMAVGLGLATYGGYKAGKMGQHDSEDEEIDFVDFDGNDSVSSAGGSTGVNYVSF